MLADPRQASIDALLRKIYEIYADFALKNPFYSLEMPIRYKWSPLTLRSNAIWNFKCILLLVAKFIMFEFSISRCELFDQNLKSALEIAEKAGNFGAGS